MSELFLSIPMMPILGGVCIGLSASVLLLLIGRIAGISGIVSALAFGSQRDNGWRWWFVIGLCAGAWLFHALSNTPYPQLELTMSNGILAVIAGILVGIGVKVGSGCTSGHGVCGIARLSLRSFVATLVFMLVAILLVWLRGSFGVL